MTERSEAEITTDGVMSWIRLLTDTSGNYPMDRALLSHLTEMHKLRDKEVRRDVRRALCAEAISSGDWAIYNHYLEMTRRSVG